MFLEPFLVLERIMLRCKRNASAFKPAVENFGNAFHYSAAFGAGESDLVHILSV